MGPVMWLISVAFCFTTAVSVPVEIVVARCKEDISWVAEYGYSSITTVLEKCGLSDWPGRQVVQTNTGREGGAYLQFIVDHYSDLAEWTVFTQGEKPTYGYRGHRLGGGHMMNNVRFQDYVEAAANRKETPLFFVFSSVLVATTENAYQCLRTGYGEDYNPPQTKANTMCGMPEDWQQWYAFPEWFKDMVVRLQVAQAAPVKSFDPKVVLNIFGVQPEGVMFFAQGARFGASREAIQSRPKEYYEGLLKHFNDVDPWAGYYLEWLWFYVLGGQSAPCGFEKATLRAHEMWVNSAARLKQQQFKVLQTASGTSGTSGTPSGTECTTLAECTAGPGTTKTVPANPNDINAAGGKLLITQNVQVQGNMQASSNGIISITQQTTILTILGFVNFIGGILQTDVSTSTTTTTSLSVSGIIQFLNSIIQSAATGVKSSFLFFAQTFITMTSNTIKCSVTFSRFKVLRLIGNLWSIGTICRLTDGNSQLNRANSDITNPSYLCGEALDALTLDSNSGAIIQSQCTANGNGAYSNTMNTLSYSSPATLRFDMVGNTNSKPILISSSWSSPSGMILQVSNASTGAYCTPLVMYNNPGSCTSSFSSTSVDSCPSGYSCTISGSQVNTTMCQVTYCQAVSSSNNDGLLGLIALVALLPIAALAGLAAWWFMKPSAAAIPEPVDQYPDVVYEQYPMYTDGMYPSAYEMAYEPTLMPSLMPSPAGATFGVPGATIGSPWMPGYY